MAASRIRYTARAARMASELLTRYEQLGRVEAARKFNAALEEADAGSRRSPAAACLRQARILSLHNRVLLA